MDEELIRLADRVFDTSDFFRRYMAGFVISTRENAVSHCGTDYVRNVNDSGKLDTKDLMCMMLGFSPIVESDSLFTDTEFRRSVISNQSRHDLINSFFSNLSNEYPNVKYPECNNITLSNASGIYQVSIHIYNGTSISGSFRVDGSVRQSSDGNMMESCDGNMTESSDGNMTDPSRTCGLVGRQYAPLEEITGATIFYNNQVIKRLCSLA